ncbi:alpha-ketoglutarate-dependent dioxygenase AlkB [Altererythrobacter sp. TH136]|uniref:alpha-ketoglutarate-dependent dioxygenase AlkB family protein n=1 Tax=Altererythrobacter sp. TH136 TaxID=2067415 RepID=UPI001164BA57|nr:alpha-ketoglutarate-dependent dioxygenase AlkB [Altererythrobacter sp. TH136]QDM40806.1 alpha-ketoglutarate-dependent dioxygenase AlkB [Altererythrobacter sp. TH136]
MGDLFEPALIDPPFSFPKGKGYLIAPNSESNGYDLTVPNGSIFYAGNYFEPRISDRMVEYLQETDGRDWRSIDWRQIPPELIEEIRFTNIKWKQDWINFFGKRKPLPRLTSWYGDPGKSYTYSGIRSEPNEWNKGLLYVKEAIEKCAKVRFNSVLLNWYRDGQDSLSWHSDDEKELGQQPVIASANFGAERDFIIRRKDDNSQKITFPMRHGTLLVMRGELQKFWEHSVPKRKNVRGSRFNLTFRRIDPAD